MGICSLCTKADTDSFFNEFLPEVGRLIPEGIALEVVDSIGDSDSVVLRVSGKRKELTELIIIIMLWFISLLMEKLLV